MKRTFTAEFKGEGYTHNIADAHIAGAHQLLLQEDLICNDKVIDAIRGVLPGKRDMEDLPTAFRLGFAFLRVLRNHEKQLKKGIRSCERVMQKARK